MKATFNEIVENLVKVFTDKAESAQYYSSNEQYICMCGWCGTMSPVSRPAYIKTFGKETTEAADRLKLLRSAAADFDRLTQAGEHVAAVNARLSALFACGVDVADLVQCADYKADQRARQRAAVVLTPDEFRTLYGYGKAQHPEDCGKVWQFARGSENSIDYEVHEIRELGGVYSIILDLCELYPEGHAFPISFNTYNEAAAYLACFRAGVRLIAEPAA